MTHQQIFLNLAVQDLPRSRAFFERLGYAFNPDFSNDQGACLVISEHIFVMLLTEAFFGSFTKKQIVNARTSAEVMVCLSAESREQIDQIVAEAVAAGATAPNPKQEYDFMYSHGFEDLDGHIWEFVYMVPGAKPNV